MNRIAVFGDVSFEFQAKIRRYLKQLPMFAALVINKHALMVDLWHDVPVCVGEELASKKPRGWPKGSTWAQADGFCCQNGRVVVTEYRFNKKNVLVRGDRPRGVLHHELGHAVDRVLNRFSHSKEFLQAYYADVGRMEFERMTGRTRKRLSYLLQGYSVASGKCCSIAGREETFAEVFASLCGRAANERDTKFNLWRFGSVARLIKRRLTSC